MKIHNQKTLFYCSCMHSAGLYTVKHGNKHTIKFNFSSSWDYNGLLLLGNATTKAASTAMEIKETVQCSYFLRLIFIKLHSSGCSFITMPLPMCISRKLDWQMENLAPRMPLLIGQFIGPPATWSGCKYLQRTCKSHQRAPHSCNHQFPSQFPTLLLLKWFFRDSEPN